MAHKLTIQQFHTLVQSSAPDDETLDALPRGPSQSTTHAHDHLQHLQHTPRETTKWLPAFGAPAATSHLHDHQHPTKTLTLDEFKAKLDACLSELFANLDVDEAVACVRELRSSLHHHYVIKRSVLRALDKTDRERELVATLFSALHVRRVLTTQQAAAGFFTLVESLDDIALDTPAASTLIAHFLADAVLDGILAPEHIDGWPAELTSRPLSARLLAETKRRIHGRHPIGAVPASAIQQMKAQLRSIVDEYLCSHDAAEVARRLYELQLPLECEWLLVRVAVEVAIERRDADREHVSRLLANLAHRVLPQRVVAQGFESLLERIDDLALDTPGADSILSAFLVRAIADDVLPPAFVWAGPAALHSDRQAATLKQARARLAATHHGDANRHVWGRATGGTVDEMKKAMADAVREYFVSADESEAVRCVRELDAPVFLHELVKKLAVLSMDGPKGGSRERALAVALAQRLVDEGILAREQLTLGCQRTLEAVPDLVLDNPRAAEHVGAFVSECKQSAD